MEASIQHIDRLAQTLAELQPMKPEYRQRLDKKIRLEFNYNSNHMEGNTLTYGETELLLIFDKTTGNHDLREYEEMKAHDVAFELMKDWATSKERPLSEMAVKNLHEILLVRPFWKEAQTPDGQATRRLINVGTYKEQPNSVRLQSGDLFEYASPQETPILMGELIQWYREEEEKEELHPVALAALLHYRFVRIHPFDDGNGRISRLLMNYVLFKHGLPPVVIKSADKKNYLFALNQADAGNLDAFIRYIAVQAVWSLELAIKAAQGEMLEEEDDLQKVIAVWKKGAVTKKTDSLHRNDELVYELYYNGGLKEMYEDFVQRHQQFFDMFKKTETIAYRYGYFNGKNSGFMPALEWLKGRVDDIVNNTHQVFHKALDMLNPVRLKDLYTAVLVVVNLKEYMHGTSSFSISSRLRIELRPYNYFVQYNGKKLAEKRYDEYLTTEERKQIVADCIRDAFMQIKINSEQ